MSVFSHACQTHFEWRICMVFMDYSKAAYFSTDGTYWRCYFDQCFVFFHQSMVPTFGASNIQFGNYKRKKIDIVVNHMKHNTLYVVRLLSFVSPLCKIGSRTNVNSLFVIIIRMIHNYQQSTPPIDIHLPLLMNDSLWIMFALDSILVYFTHNIYLHRCKSSQCSPSHD